jgi:hypothetical protein
MDSSIQQKRQSPLGILMVVIVAALCILIALAASGAFTPKTAAQRAIDAIQNQTPEQKRAAIEARIEQIQSNPKMPDGMKGQAIAMLKASEQRADHPNTPQ